MTTHGFDGRDGAALEALLAGDAAAWRLFHDRYEGFAARCISSVTRRFPAASPEDAREIRSQFYVSLLSNDKAKLRAYDRARGSFSTYLGVLAVRCAYDWLRHARREGRPCDLADAGDVCSGSVDPFEVAAHKERSALAARVLQSLSARERRFATLYFVDGVPPRQIARSMNISLKTVYSKKHKIKNKLKGKLESMMSRVKARGLAA